MTYRRRFYAFATGVLLLMGMGAAVPQDQPHHPGPGAGNAGKPGSSEKPIPAEKSVVTHHQMWECR